MLQERARIARELHDSVSQTLYAITLGAVRARSLLKHDENAEVQRIVDDLLQLANEGQSELRALLSDIRSSRCTSGRLRAALENLAADVRSRHGLDIRLLVGSEPEVPAATAEALVLIAREALLNVTKHAHATRAEMELKPEAGHLAISITDDGLGFDQAEPRPGHFGLQSMRERAAAVGGTLSLVSGVGRGTQVRMTIPVHLDPDG